MNSWGSVSKIAATYLDDKFKSEAIEKKNQFQPKQILFESFKNNYLDAARANK